MPAVSERTIAVEGFRELSKACADAGKETAKLLRGLERETAEPVRRDAQALVTSGITHIGPVWSRMRVGTTRTAVYVAPKARGVKSRGLGSRRRPNLAGLMAPLLEQALDQNADRIEADVDRMLGIVEAHWGQGG